MSGFVDKANLLREKIAAKKRERDGYSSGENKFVHINDDGRHDLAASQIKSLDNEIEALEIELLKLGA